MKGKMTHIQINQLIVFYDWESTTFGHWVGKHNFDTIHKIFMMQEVEI